MAADGLKQRLVGGAALLVIGVVAWFWLLSADSPVDPVARETQIPPAPDLQPFAVAEPQAPKDVIPAPEPGASEADAASTADSATVDPATVDSATTAAVPAQRKPAIASLPNTPAKTTTQPLIPKAIEPKNVASKNVEPKNIPPKNIESKSTPVKTPTQTFSLDQQGLPVAWVIQVGLFSTQANADRIKNELQQKGFKAYTQTVKTAKGAGIKVFVGPKLSRERADAQKKAIDAALQTNTMVVRFTPS